MDEKKLIEETDRDKTYEGNEEGVCANCGSTEIIMTNREQMDSNYIHYEGFCDNCGATTIEVHRTVFKKTIAIVNK